MADGLIQNHTVPVVLGLAALLGFGSLPWVSVGLAEDALGTSWSLCATVRGVNYCGTAAREGSSNIFDAQFDNGAVSRLTVSLSGDQVTVARLDTGGPALGCTETWALTLSRTTFTGRDTARSCGAGDTITAAQVSWSGTISISGGTQPPPPVSEQPSASVNCTVLDRSLSVSSAEVAEMAGFRARPSRSATDIAADVQGDLEGLIRARGGSGSYSCTINGVSIAGSVAAPSPPSSAPPAPGLLEGATVQPFECNPQAEGVYTPDDCQNALAKVSQIADIAGSVAAPLASSPAPPVPDDPTAFDPLTLMPDGASVPPFECGPVAIDVQPIFTRRDCVKAVGGVFQIAVTLGSDWDTAARIYNCIRLDSGVVAQAAEGAERPRYYAAIVANCLSDFGLG